MKREGTRGFTLLEVMVALAILAIALGAAIKAASTNAANAAYLRDKTLAQWVAMNVVTELQLSPEWVEVGERRGRVEMAEVSWRWSAQITPTFDEAVRRVDVMVATADAQEERAQLVAYLPRPASVVLGTP